MFLCILTVYFLFEITDYLMEQNNVYCSYRDAHILTVIMFQEIFKREIYAVQNSANYKSKIASKTRREIVELANLEPHCVL